MSAAAEACRSVAAEVAKTVGRVSILVNNAGINRRNAFTAEPAAVFRIGKTSWLSTSMAFSTSRTLFSSNCAEARGRIINIASIQSFVHVRTPNSPAYTTSKHGVLGLTRALAAEAGVRMVCASTRSVQD